MKRIQIVILQALVLLYVCAQVGRQYIAHYIQGYAVLNNTTTQNPIEVSPPTTHRLQENHTSDEDQAKTTTSRAATASTQIQYTPARESTSPTETPTKRPYTSSLASINDGDSDLLREIPRYIQAIMNPSDTTFPRLSCPAPTHTRSMPLIPKPAQVLIISKPLLPSEIRPYIYLPPPLTLLILTQSSFSSTTLRSAWKTSLSSSTSAFSKPPIDLRHGLDLR